MGSRYFLYRLRHEMERRNGALVKRFPVDPEEKYFSDKEGLKGSNFYFDRKEIKVCQNYGHKTKASQIRGGKLHFFSAEWIDLGLDYNWRVNPKTGYEYPLTHWSKINEFDPKSGDIKYVWEKSRFIWLLDVIREDYYQGSDHSAFVFEQIDDWIDSNPINLGPNYRCSQEMSVRLWNWSFAFHFYYDSEAFTEERWQKYQNVIYWHLDHIYKHIDFSRIAVRNNHAITETALLFVSQWLFPFIPETEIWSKQGEKWFNQEIDYQIYEDGTFLQFSMNYHRVVVQTLTATISLAHKNGFEMQTLVYDRAYASVNFLYQCMGNCQEGYLPNYGQNDGAWFFPWTSTNYRDFRPQINALYYCLTGYDLFSSKEVIEERMWWDSISLERGQYAPIKRRQGFLEFKNGGYLLYQNIDVVLFFRNGNHRDRPAQADNHHIDLWYKGQNILMDSGTFKYNTTPLDIQWYMGSKGHNVAQIDDHDQMLKGGRFIWYYWSQSNYLKYGESDTSVFIEGVIDAFQHLNRKCKVKRHIELFLEKRILKVKDEILNANDFSTLHQNWHYNLDVNVRTKHELSIREGEYSCYYGHKQKNNFARVSSTSRKVESQISF